MIVAQYLEPRHETAAADSVGARQLHAALTELPLDAVLVQPGLNSMPVYAASALPLEAIKKIVSANTFWVTFRSLW